MRYCLIYWNECHLVCYVDTSSVVTATPGMAMPAPPPSLLGSTADPASRVRGDKECYVMKLYRLPGLR